jgi:hypothetical protein
MVPTDCGAAGGPIRPQYKDWQAEHGLYLGDVPENLTTNEREWLRAFIQRWNAACDLERASAVAA